MAEDMARKCTTLFETI